MITSGRIAHATSTARSWQLARRIAEEDLERDGGVNLASAGWHVTRRAVAASSVLG